MEWIAWIIDKWIASDNRGLDNNFKTKMESRDTKVDSREANK